MGEHLAIARVSVKSASDTDAIAKAIASLAKASRREKGCKTYEVFSNTETPGDLLIRKINTDTEALAYHKTTSHIAEFEHAIDGLAVVDVRAFDIS